MMPRDKIIHSRLDGQVVHPGRILAAEWMRAFDLSQNELARMMGCSARRVNEIVHGRRAITADSAWRLSRCFATTPHYWLHLQADYELERSPQAPFGVQPAATERVANQRRQRERPPGWRRATSVEYRAAKKKEAILSFIQREELGEFLDRERWPPDPE